MRRILKWKGLLAFLTAFVMMSQPAGAGHITFSFSVATATTNAYSDTTSTINYGTTEVASQTIQLPNGWKVAQQTGTTPISPIPLDGHTVGTGTATATWEPFCNGSSSNKTMTPRWESTIDAGAPANTVAQINVAVDFLFTTKVYVVRNAAEDYDLVVPDMPDTFVCNGKASSMTLTIWGDYASQGTTYRVAQNPSTAGNYKATLTGTESGGTNHTTDSNTVAIS